MNNYPSNHIPECERKPTTRKVIYKNWHKCRERYLILNSYLKKNKLSWKADFWWAKVQRKLVLLEMLCSEFEKQKKCECKACNFMQPIEERVGQIRNKLHLVRESLIPIAVVFAEVPPTYGYGMSSPEYARKERKIEILKLEREEKIILKFKVAQKIIDRSQKYK